MAGDASSLSELLASAEQDLRRAVSIDPGRARAWSSLSDLLLLARQEFAEAKIAAENAYEADPFLGKAEEILSRLQQAALDAGEYEEARRWALEGRRRFPDVADFVAAELMLLTLLPAERGDSDRAWALADTIVGLSPPHSAARHGTMAKMQVVMVLGRAGFADSARAVLERTRDEAGDRGSIAYEEAAAWLAIGDEERCLEALRIHVDAYPEDRAYLSSDTWFEALWEDPRFQELVSTAS
jgi:tetratricopeptide (TPR) repeat protein